jgi:transcriptional regulator with XRE-family HTH domain
MEKPLPALSHENATGLTVAENIQRTRKSQQVSLAELAARLDKMGRRIGLSSLSKIENGDRRVDVDDLVAIALALDVSPLGLLLPRGEFHQMRIITGGVGSLPLIWDWARGLKSLEYPGDDRAFAARSLPSWIITEGDDFEPDPRPEYLELGWKAADGDLRVHETHRMSNHNGLRYELKDAVD